MLDVNDNNVLRKYLADRQMVPMLSWDYFYLMGIKIFSYSRIKCKESAMRFHDGEKIIRTIFSAQPEFLSFSPDKQKYCTDKMVNSGKNLGIFAAKNIPKNTIICRAADKMHDKPISELINDLCFYPYMQKNEYLSMDNVEKYTNVRIVEINGVWYIESIKDIYENEELSRLYGVEYWFKAPELNVDAVIKRVGLQYDIEQTFNCGLGYFIENDHVLAICLAGQQESGILSSTVADAEKMRITVAEKMLIINGVYVLNIDDGIYVLNINEKRSWMYMIRGGMLRYMVLGIIGKSNPFTLDKIMRCYRLDKIDESKYGYVYDDFDYGDEVIYSASSIFGALLNENSVDEGCVGG